MYNKSTLTIIFISLLIVSIVLLNLSNDSSKKLELAHNAYFSKNYIHNNFSKTDSQKNKKNAKKKMHSELPQRVAKP